jgi:hypothetical protein
MVILSNKIVIYLDFKMENPNLTEKLTKKIQQLREKRMKKYNLVVCFCVINGLPLILKVIDPDVARKSSSLPARLLYGGEEVSTFDMRQSFSGSGELYENRSHYSSRYIVMSGDGITIEVFNEKTLVLVYSFKSAVVRPDLVESPVSNVEIKLFTLDTDLIDDNIESLIKQLVSLSPIGRIEG